jgi:hypothetical protein
MAKTWLLFTAVTAALLAVTTAQANTYLISLGAGQTQFAALETASYMSACHALSHNGAVAETITETIESFASYLTPQTLSQAKIILTRKP